MERFVWWDIGSITVWSHHSRHQTQKKKSGASKVCFINIWFLSIFKIETFQYTQCSFVCTQVCKNRPFVRFWRTEVEKLLRAIILCRLKFMFKWTTMWRYFINFSFQLDVVAPFKSENSSQRLWEWSMLNIYKICLFLCSTRQWY